MIVDNGVITLTSETATCEVAPRAGGAVAGFWWKRGGQRIDWLRPASPSAVARRGADGLLSHDPLWQPHPRRALHFLRTRSNRGPGGDAYAARHPRPWLAPGLAGGGAWRGPAH